MARGLSDIANLIYQDAKQVAQARTDAAVMKAQGDIGIMNQKFLAWVGSAEFTPDAFDSKFKELQDQQEAYADSIEMPRARPLVKGAAQATLPSIYAQGAAVMNRQQLGLASADFMSSVQTAEQDYSVGAQERWAKVSALYDQGRKLGFIDQEKLGKARAASYRLYRQDLTEETARAQGTLQDGIDFIYDNDKMVAAGFGELSLPERDAVASRLLREQTVNSNNAVKNFNEQFSAAEDQFLDLAGIQAGVDALDISPDSKERIIAASKAHNDDALYTNYLQRINNTASAETLEAILEDLRVEGSGVNGQNDTWIGTAQEKRRAELMAQAQKKLEVIINPTGEDGSEAARFSMLYEYYKSGKLLNGERVTWATAYNAGVSMNTTNKTNPAFKRLIDDLESFMPENAKTTFDTIKSTITGGTKGFWKENPKASAWAMDAFYDFVKNNPTASQQEFSKAAESIKAVYIAGEWDYLKNKKIEDKVFQNAESQLVALGGKIQRGALEAAVNIDPASGAVQVAPNVAPAYAQWSAWEAQQASSRYGISATPHTMEDGTQVLISGGKAYRFVYEGNKAYLVDEKGKKLEELNKPDEKPDTTFVARPEARGYTTPPKPVPATSDASKWPDKVDAYPAPSGINERAWNSYPLAARKKWYESNGYTWDGTKFVKK